jgi:hypothetical protein
VKRMFLLAVFSMFVLALSAGAAFADTLYGGIQATSAYTVPTEIIPSDVSSDNLTSIFSVIIGNSAVLTLILVGLAVALFSLVMRVFRKMRSA